MEWAGQIEDWRIDWATYGGPYIRYPDYPHPENGHTIAKLCFADPTPFEDKRQRATLIAAAPAMRDALEAMLKLFGKPHPEEYVDGGASYQLAVETVRNARAVLDGIAHKSG